MPVAARKMHPVHEKVRELRLSGVERLRRSPKKFVRLRSLEKRFPKVAANTENDRRSETLPPPLVREGQGELETLEYLLALQSCRIREMVATERASGSWIHEIRKEMKVFIKISDAIRHLKMDLGITVPISKPMAEAMECLYFAVERNRGRSIHDAFIDFLLHEYNERRRDGQSVTPELATLRSVLGNPDSGDPQPVRR